MAQKPKYVLVVHGGAGTIVKKQMTAEREQAYIQAISEALKAGYEIIRSGGRSTDAVEATIRVMEDNPLFNAGKGAVFTHEGRNELDASIMEGRTLKAGAVAGVTTIKNPISAAKAVMEQSVHVMMAGAGAEQFARAAGLTMVDPGYFRTENRWQGLQRILREDSLKTLKPPGSHSFSAPESPAAHKFGTVGCVALDQAGDLAAGTSTGGMANKKYGRIGDSPIIGAGTYCDNRTTGISCTGWGEFFIRTAAAKTVSDLIEYKGESLENAARSVLNKIAAMGGSGGMILLNRQGAMAMPFNTKGMFRGAITENGQVEVYMYE